jgi:hypothetical protein
MQCTVSTHRTHLLSEHEGRVLCNLSRALPPHPCPWHRGRTCVALSKPPPHDGPARTHDVGQRVQVLVVVAPVVQVQADLRLARAQHLVRRLAVAQRQDRPPRRAALGAFPVRDDQGQVTVLRTTAKSENFNSAPS